MRRFTLQEGSKTAEVASIRSAASSVLQAASRPGPALPAASRGPNFRRALDGWQPSAAIARGFSYGGLALAGRLTPRDPRSLAGAGIVTPRSGIAAVGAIDGALPRPVDPRVRSPHGRVSTCGAVSSPLAAARVTGEQTVQPMRSAAIAAQPALPGAAERPPAGGYRSRRSATAGGRRRCCWTTIGPDVGKAAVSASAGRRSVQVQQLVGRVARRSTWTRAPALTEAVTGTTDRLLPADWPAATAIGENRAFEEARRRSAQTGGRRAVRNAKVLKLDLRRPRAWWMLDYWTLK